MHKRKWSCDCAVTRFIRVAAFFYGSDRPGWVRLSGGVRFVKVLISDTKCGIERNNFFIVLKAEVFRGELDRISGLVSVHIDL